MRRPWSTGGCRAKNKQTNKKQINKQKTKQKTNKNKKTKQTYKQTKTINKKQTNKNQTNKQKQTNKQTTHIQQVFQAARHTDTAEIYLIRHNSVSSENNLWAGRLGF